MFRPLTVDPATGNVLPASVNGHPLNLPASALIGGAVISTFTQAAADILYAPVIHTHSFAQLTGSIALAQIPNGLVTLAKLADMATASLIYRKTAGSGAPEVNSLATLKTDLGLIGINSGDQTITLTGDVTGSGTGSFVATIANSAVSLAKMADMATGSLIYRKTAGSGAPEVNSLATLKTDLGLTGTNSGDQTITLTGDVTGGGTGSFAATIANGAVTLAKMANMATASLVYRKTAGSGAPEVNSLATLKTDLGLTGTNSGDQTITLTGDVTGSGTGSFAATIANSAVTLAKMANMATASFLGRNTAATGVPEVLSVATAKTMLSLTGTNSGDQTITLTGDVTGSGTGSFAATIASGVVTLAKMADMATASLIYRKTAGSGAPEVNSLATLKTDLGLTGTNSGDQTITLTGDVTGSGSASFAATIANSAVSLAKMADMATASLIYRKTAGTGAPEVNSLATLKTDLGLTGTNSGDQTITLTGDVTGSGTGSFATTIASGAVSLAKMANMATASLLGRNTAATGVPEVLSAATARSLLALSTSSAVEFKTLRLTTTAAADIPMIIRGVGADNAGTDNTHGLSLIVGHNTTGNRQFWIGDSADAGSTSQWSFRYIVGSGFNVPNIDAIRNDGTVAGNINLGGSGVNVGVGFTAGTVVQGDITEKLQVVGSVRISNVYKVAANQVVGARKTGWAVASGTATRTTFDTATVTLPQLAERLKALIDDLHATAGHGLIGT